MAVENMPPEDDREEVRFPESQESPFAKKSAPDRELNRPACAAARTSPLVIGYAIFITLLLMMLLVTGRIHLSAGHVLESLPDVRPLSPNEFRKVPDGTKVPAGHEMKIGDSRRFGDVVVTPVRVSREQLEFRGFLSGETDERLTSEPVLKLWLKLQNVSEDYGFPPYDAALMSHRSPPDSKDPDTAVNSCLDVVLKTADRQSVRVLNFLHSMDNNFVIAGQDSARVIMPGETLTTFVASSEQLSELTISPDSAFTWRVQFRKGIHRDSGNGVTTLIDVGFSGADIAESTAPAVTPASG